MPKSVVLLSALAVVLALPAAASAGASSPTDPRCYPLIAGTTGLLVGGDNTLPTADKVAGRPGGYGPVAPAAVTKTLPDSVLFKTARETFAGAHAFAVRDGVMYLRPAKLGQADPKQPWRVLKLPDCMKGGVASISADDRLLIAVTNDRQMYSNNMPDDDVAPERWTWRWGPYFWTGLGMKMFGDISTWAASEFNSDERFTDTSGRDRAPLGVATVYTLRDNGRRITYLDPWLPQDDSRQVCGPRRNTVPLATLAASGSTVFAASTRGELFTRLYDFDVSGANTVLGKYTWQQDRPASDARWQLPGPSWVRQPVPPGTITDRLTITKTGLKAGDRLLRIEGRTKRGRIGYWEKAINARTWRFTRTGGRLTGHTLSRRLPAPLIAPDDHLFSGTIDGARAEVLDLNAECSPATLRVHLASGKDLNLLLHTSDALRQDTRAAGLDDTPREYNGAIEVPRATFASTDPAVRSWIGTHLAGRRIATAPVALTRTRLLFLAQCWQMTLDGLPARVDVPRIPPDLGMIAARELEAAADGRPLVSC